MSAPDTRIVGNAGIPGSLVPSSLRRALATKQSISPRQEKLDCFAAPAMTADTSSASQRQALEDLLSTSCPLQSEGAGIPGADAPAAIGLRKMRHGNTGHPAS